ncbi:MAG: hypothetical protein ACM3RP_09135 [Chitinophagales bacterium]
MIVQGFVGLVLNAPLLVLWAYLLFHDGWPATPALMQERVVATRWQSLAVTPAFSVLSAYGSFSALAIVRENLRPLAAWRHAFGLIPRRDWLQTIGLLALFQSLVALLGMVVPAISVSPGLVRALFALIQLVGLSLCHVARWRAFRPGDGTVEA